MEACYRSAPITACWPDELCHVGIYPRVEIERLELGAASSFWSRSRVSGVYNTIMYHLATKYF